MRRWACSSKVCCWPSNTAMLRRPNLVRPRASSTTRVQACSCSCIPAAIMRPATLTMRVDGSKHAGLVSPRRDPRAYIYMAPSRPERRSQELLLQLTRTCPQTQPFPVLLDLLVRNAQTLSCPHLNHTPSHRTRPRKEIPISPALEPSTPHALSTSGIAPDNLSTSINLKRRFCSCCHSWPRVAAASFSGCS